MTFLTLEGVSKRYGFAVALDSIDLAVEAGARAAIVGPSGSGKTTLLRIVAGFEAPDAGRVTLDGAVLADATSFVPAHRRGVGVVMQDGALFPHLSVGDNIGFGLDRDTPNRAARIKDLMEMVGLDAAMLTRRPDALSGGQQQRVALARALARAPRLMLLDEPFSALDTGLRASTRKTVSDLLQAAGITTILVTHDQAEALSFADHIAVMAGGVLLQAGPPRELYTRPSTRTVAEFLGDAIILPAHLHDGRAECALGTLTTTPGRSGSTEIMLRPEQISLIPLPPGLPPPIGAACAEIITVEFAGASSTVVLSLCSAPTTRLSLAHPSDAALKPGTVVQVAVLGQAHAFP